jgi:hypothetical protein
MSVVPSAEPDEGEPEEPAGAPIGPDEREAAEVPPPYTCPTCGHEINGGEVLCLVPGCDGVAKGALQCRPCELPVAPNATCTSAICWRQGGGFASPPDWDNPTAAQARKWHRENLLGDCRSSTTGWHPHGTGGGGAWDGPWPGGPHYWLSSPRR